MECVDKIRDTATSHDRIFFVEVMGRDAGFLAQNSAIASGAEAAIIPEDRTDADQLETFIGRGFRKTKNSSIVIVTESPGNKNGGAMHYADRVKGNTPDMMSGSLSWDIYNGEERQVPTPHIGQPAG